MTDSRSKKGQRPRSAADWSEVVLSQGAPARLEGHKEIVQADLGRRTVRSGIPSRKADYADSCAKAGQGLGQVPLGQANAWIGGYIGVVAQKHSAALPDDSCKALDKLTPALRLAVVVLGPFPLPTVHTY